MRQGQPKASRVNDLLLRPATKPLLALVLLAPLGWLIFAAAQNQLGANPAQYLLRATGLWTLRLLCLVLLLTPVRVLLGWTALARLRRMVGLTVYFYALLHLLSYSWFDMGLDWGDIVRDIPKRPFILVGFTAFVLLSALALTSFNWAVRWLGARRWQALHRSVYAVAVLVMLHFFWMRAAKHNFAQVALYGAVLTVLLGWRLQKYMRNRALALSGRA